MNSSLPDIGDVTTTQIGGLEIRLARGGRSDGIPILLTSPWPESIYAFRGILPAIKELGPLILVTFRASAAPEPPRRDVPRGDGGLRHQARRASWRRPSARRRA